MGKSKGSSSAAAPAASAPPKTETTALRCDVKKVKVGSYFSRHSGGTVVAIDPHQQMMQLRNATGFQWGIGFNIMEQEFSFADQFDGEEKVARTRAIEILTENYATAMTVCFRTKLEPEKVAAVLAPGKGSDDEKTWLKKVEEATAGEERTMVGQHGNSFDEFRRLRFNEYGKGVRTLDPRTIEWLIVNRVKYVVK